MSIWNFSITNFLSKKIYYSIRYKEYTIKYTLKVTKKKLGKKSIFSYFQWILQNQINSTKHKSTPMDTTSENEEKRVNDKTTTTTN